MTANDGSGDSLDSISIVVRRGDRDGFNRLMSDYMEFLQNSVERRMDAKLRQVQEPQDVVQDVLLQAYRGFFDAKFPNNGAFRSWLETLVKNRLIDLDRRHFRTQRRQMPVRSLDETVPGSEGMHRGDQVAAQGPSPSSWAGRREAVEALDRVIASLSPRDRELIRFFHLEGLPYLEIATRTGMTVAAVRKAVPRALKAAGAAMKRPVAVDLHGEVTT